MTIRSGSTHQPVLLPSGFRYNASSDVVPFAGLLESSSPGTIMEHGRKLDDQRSLTLNVERIAPPEIFFNPQGKKHQLTRKNAKCNRRQQCDWTSPHFAGTLWVCYVSQSESLGNSWIYSYVGTFHCGTFMHVLLQIMISSVAHLQRLVQVNFLVLIRLPIAVDWLHQQRVISLQHFNLQILQNNVRYQKPYKDPYSVAHLCYNQC